MANFDLVLLCSHGILQVNEERESGRDHDNIDLKHGEIDAQNMPHVGGGNWAGGTGKSVCLSVCLSVFLSVCSSVRLSVSLIVSLLVCQTVC